VLAAEGNNPLFMGEMATAEPMQLHRALADRSRARIAEELRNEPDGLDAQALGRRLGLHANTVRWHLGVLRDAGLVTARRAERTTPGRPRTLYALRPSATTRDRDEFRLLASVLTTMASQEPDAGAKAEAAGHRWGRYLAPRRPPLTAMTQKAATDDVMRMLDEQGFEPEASGTEIALRRCPFYDLAEQHPQVVCRVHKGILAGALEEIGSELDVELEPFVRADLCLVRLLRRE
jgi:predicted ArsR family transcriptional regulator